MKALCKIHQNILLFWCKGCSKAMCQKCVVEHSIKQFRKIHQLVELSTLKSDVQKEATELSQELDSLLQKLLPEYNLVEQQRIGLQLLQRSQLILQQAISNYFSELKQTFITLTSNHSNITQKKQLQEELEKIMNELNEYIQSTDFQVSEFYERDFRSIIKQMRENVLRFIEKTKIEYKKPNLKINEKFTQDLSQILSNYVSITFERPLLEKTEYRVPKPKQTLHFTVERNSQRIERKMTLLNPSNLIQSQILNHTYQQVITEQNLEDQLIQQFDQNEEIQNIIVLDQSKLRYLHSLIDPQTLFIHDIQLKENQLISLPESAQIPHNAQTLITSDLILYICGGINKNSQPSQNFYQFDNSQGLLQLQNIPIPINQHSIIYIKGFLYIIGGKTNQGISDKCWRYVVNNKQWEEFAQLNQPRSHHQCCSFESEDQTSIYVFFGLGKDGNILDSIEKYNNVERKWQNILIKNMISGLASLKCCCVQLDEKRILIYGGYYKNLKNSNKMITFHTESSVIDNLNQLCLPLGQLQGQPITNNNAIYSLHNCPDQIVPKYTELADVLSILEISNTSCHFADIINCRQLTLKKN